MAWGDTEVRKDRQCKDWPNRLASWKGTSAHLQAPCDTGMVSTVTTRTPPQQRDLAPRAESAKGGARWGDTRRCEKIGSERTGPIDSPHGRAPVPTFRRLVTLAWCRLSPVSR